MLVVVYQGMLYQDLITVLILVVVVVIVVVVVVIVEVGGSFEHSIIDM